MFDAHKDSIDPGRSEVLRSARANLTTEKLIDICRNELRVLDDDWVKAGMELGIFADTVVFGGWLGNDPPDVDVYQDKSTSQNHAFIKSELPLHALAYQGELSDCSAKDATDQHLWRLLGWQFHDGVFGFAGEIPPIVLSIDLDCFVASWRGYKFPWPDEIFESEFQEPSKYSSTIGWTGKRFLNALIQRAGLITFAREKECTGGAKKARQILQKLNHFVLDERLPSGWYSKASA